MNTTGFDKIFNPAALAVVGVADPAQNGGLKLIQNLLQSGYTGAIYPIVPRRNMVLGIPAYPSLADAPTPIDLVLLCGAGAASASLIETCARAGASGLVILNADGLVRPASSQPLADAVCQAAAVTGLRIIGPDSLGIFCHSTGLNALLTGPAPLGGKLAFVAQGSATFTSVLTFALQARMGFAHMISLGSMADIDFGDLVDYLGSAFEVSGIVLCIEQIKRCRNFMSAARAASRIKPIVALKIGRDRSRPANAGRHLDLGVLKDRIYDAAFERAGILRVKTFEELLGCAHHLAKQPRAVYPGLAIITNAPDLGTMAADALDDYGLAPAALSPETIARLDAALGSGWSHANPVVAYGDVAPETYIQALDACRRAPEIRGILIILAPQLMSAPFETASLLATHLRKKAYPALTSWMGGPDVSKFQEIFNYAGLTTYDTPERAVRAFVNLQRYSRNIEMLQQIPPKYTGDLGIDNALAQALITKHLPGPVFLSAVDAKAVLGAYGIPVNPTETAFSAAKAVKKAQKIGLPVVMKALPPAGTDTANLPVELDLKSTADVYAAFGRLTAADRQTATEEPAPGVTIEPMLKRPDYQLALGAHTDPDFGPVIFFGTGGIMAHGSPDRALGLPPLNRLLARRLMEETRIFRLLSGAGNRPPADVSCLEELLIRLSQLVTDFPAIHQIDINPLLVSRDLARVADVRILLKPVKTPTPLHLVISPYPNQYETTFDCAGVGRLLIRPIRPEDAPLMIRLFETLSRESIYFRYFNVFTRLPDHLLARLTQIDYDREIALVALGDTGSGEQLLGVSRIIRGLDSNQAEFSVVVGDPWHGKGIGAALLKRCLSIAKTRGIKRVWGVVLPDNTQMLALGKKLNFTVKRVPGASEYELHIDLTRLNHTLADQTI